MSQRNRMIERMKDWVPGSSHDSGRFGCATIATEEADTGIWGLDLAGLRKCYKQQASLKRAKLVVNAAIGSPMWRLSHAKSASKFVVIEQETFDALLKRLAVLEEKIGVTTADADLAKAPISPRALSEIHAMAAEVFGQEVSITNEKDNDEFGALSRLSVKVVIPSGTDSDTTSALVSRWYRRLREILPDMPTGSIGLDLDFQ